MVPAVRSKRIKRRGVHFIFASHHPDSSYMRGSPAESPARTHLYEIPSGSRLKNWDLVVSQNPVGASRFVDARRRYLAEFLLAPHREVLPAETGNWFQRKYVKRLIRREDAAQHAFFKSPTRTNFLRVVRAMARAVSYREKLMVNSIVRAGKENKLPLEFRVGSAHSLLSKKLRKKGIPSSREIDERVFSPYVVLMRKLEMGTKLSRISEREVDEAFLDRVLTDHFMEIIHKNSSLLKEQSYDWAVHIVKALIRDISDAQRRELVRSPDVVRLLELNGIPRLSTIERLLKFAQEKSVFLRRQRANRE